MLQISIGFSSANVVVKKIRQTNLNKRIFLIGPIYSIREKINIIDNCEFMIYVSYADAFPLTVIE